EQGGGPTPRVAESKPLPEPTVAKDPSDIVAVARAEKKNFPIAASQPKFLEVLELIRTATGKAPVESSKRPGVYPMGLGRKRLATLANHYQMPAPTFGK